MARICQTRLANGLHVILKATHVAPVVSTWMWYRVGSRNEVNDYTGLSHWVEHMMFKGSRQYPKGSIMRLVDRHGGYANAMTSHDFTAYYTTLPSNHADLPLEIETNRMTEALFDPDEVNAERTVILSEREGKENEPQYVLAEEVTAAAFRVHPYHHQSIGWRQDLEAIDREALYRFYRRHYVPSNAVLVVVGDIEIEAHQERIRDIFGPIPQGSLPKGDVPQEPPQRGERRVRLHMPGSAPMVRISYHTPPVSHKDYIPLVVTDAVLSGGKAMFAFSSSLTRSARLYRALVETELASSAGSTYHPSLDPYLMTLGATVRNGQEPRAVELALLEEIEKLRSQPVPADELQIAIKQTQAQFAYSSESVTSQALTLGFLEMVDDHERMETILEELAQVSADDILRVAQRYLIEDERIVGLYEPTQERETHTQKPAWQHPQQTVAHYRPPKGAITPESIHRQTLANGITILVNERPTSAATSISGQLSAGSLMEDAAEAGLAAVTAAMLRRGTSKHSYQHLSYELDAVGASISFAGGRDEVSFAGRSLTTDFELLASLLGEMLISPSFPEEELAKIQGQIITNLGVLEMDTNYRASQAFREALYGEAHPYGRPLVGTKETIASVTASRLRAFYERCYNPSDLVISVVGSIDMSRVVDALSAALGNWSPASSPQERSFPESRPASSIMRRQVHIPGRPQTDILIGNLGMSRTSADYYPALMANIILGHQGLMGRLGALVRDAKGLAYHITSSLHSGRGQRPWTINAGVNTEHIDAALQAILATIDKLRTQPVSDEELADCKSYLKGALPLQLETNEGIADFLLATEIYDLGTDFLMRYPSIIDRVTKEAIQRVVNVYLPPEAYVVAMAGEF